MYYPQKLLLNMSQIIIYQGNMGMEWLVEMFENVVYISLNGIERAQLPHIIVS